MVDINDVNKASWNEFLEEKIKDENVAGLSLYFVKELFPNFDNCKSYLKMKYDINVVDKGIIILDKKKNIPLEFYPLHSILWVEFFVKK